MAEVVDIDTTVSFAVTHAKMKTSCMTRNPFAVKGVSLYISCSKKMIFALTRTSIATINIKSHNFGEKYVICGRADACKVYICGGVCCVGFKLHSPPEKFVTIYL